MDTSNEYIRMCEKVPKELWDNMPKEMRLGALLKFRSFIGMICPTHTPVKLSELAQIIPETLAFRTWCSEYEDVLLIKGGVDGGGDKGVILYRQDQLQEMLPKKDVKHSIVDFKTFVWNGQQYGCDAMDCYPLNTCESMEQLWLAFVMHTLYNKIWNGTDWVVK